MRLIIFVHYRGDTALYWETKTPTSKLEKGFRLYAATYIHSYEVSNKDKLTVQVSVRALCYRSMRREQERGESKSEAPQFESRQEAVFIPVQWCLFG
ncbi:unnamed protein product [Arctogadus glacialis]